MHTPSAGKAVHILLGIFNRKIIWPRPLRAIGNHQTVALLCNSIGLSPPRLHYDRAANYGSIIIHLSLLWPVRLQDPDFTARALSLSLSRHGGPAVWLRDHLP